MGRAREARTTAVSSAGVTGIEPELWVDRAGAAVAFYQAAFGATVLHRVGDGDDIVAQLSVDGAAFWVAAADSTRRRFSPGEIGRPIAGRPPQPG